MLWDGAFFFLSVPERYVGTHLVGCSFGRYTKHPERDPGLVLVEKRQLVSWPTDHLTCSPARCEAARVVSVPLGLVWRAESCWVGPCA